MCVSTHTWKRDVSWDASFCPVAPILVICNCSVFRLFSFVFAAPSMEPRASCVWALFRMNIPSPRYFFTPMWRFCSSSTCFLLNWTHFYPNRYILPKPCKCRTRCHVTCARCTLQVQYWARCLRAEGYVDEGSGLQDARTSLMYMKQRGSCQNQITASQTMGGVDLRD